MHGCTQVRFMARSFGVSGDHLGQQSNGYRWPFGPVALITPCVPCLVAFCTVCHTGCGCSLHQHSRQLSSLHGVLVVGVH